MALYKVLIDHTKVPSDQANYKLYVDLDDMPDSFFSTVTSSGGDIRCYFDQTKTIELAREVVWIDKTGKRGEIHINVPTASSSTGTDVYVEVDGVSTEPAFTSTYGRNAVWSGYAAVYHSYGPAPIDISQLPTSVDDDFTGTDGDAPDDELWSITNDSASGTIQINSNKLRISIPNTANDESIQSVSKFLLSGDFDVQIDYEEISKNAPSSSTSYPAAFSYNNFKGDYGVLRTRLDTSGVPLMRAEGNAMTSVSGSTFYSSGKFRFVRTSGVIKGYYWTGSQWEWDGDTAGITMDPSLTDDLYIFFYTTADYDSGATTDFDNFTLNSGNIEWTFDVDDDFTGTDGDAPDDELWEIANNSVSGTCQINSNKLRITVPDTANDESVAIRSLFRIRGNFDIQIDFDEIVTTQPSSSTSWPVGLFIYFPDGSVSYLRQSYNYLGSYATAAAGTTTTFTQLVGTYFTSGKFRITRNGSVIKGYYWDGSQWEWDNDTAGFTFSETNTDEVQVRVITSADFDAGSTIDYDNFTVNSGTVVYPLPEIVDSTGNGNDGTGHWSMTIGDCVTGKIGKAIDFDGTDDVINIGDKLDIGTNDFSFSAWFKNRNTTDGKMTSLAKSSASINTGRWAQTVGSTGVFTSLLHLTETPDRYISNIVAADALNDSSWHLAVTTFDRDGNHELKIDNSSIGTDDISSYSTIDLNSTDYCGMGAYPDNTGQTYAYNFLDGLLSELRVAYEVWSSDLQTTVYNNQNSPGTFYTITLFNDVTLLSVPGISYALGTADTGLSTIVLPGISYASSAFPSVGTGITAEFGVSLALGASTGPSTINLTSTVSNYLLTLTGIEDGLEDIVIPMSSFQILKRSGRPTYIQAILPTLQYLDEVIARRSGQIKIQIAFKREGEFVGHQTIAAVAFDRLSWAQGKRSSSIIIDGRKTVTYANKTIDLENARTVYGGDTIRCEVSSPALNIEPGDTVNIGEHTFVADSISYYLSMADNNTLSFYGSISEG